MGSIHKKATAWASKTSPLVGRVLNADPTARLLNGKGMRPELLFDGLGVLGINKTGTGQSEAAPAPITPQGSFGGVAPQGGADSAVSRRMGAGASTAPYPTAPKPVNAFNAWSGGAAQPAPNGLHQNGQAAATAAQDPGALFDKYAGQGALDALAANRSSDTKTLISKAMDQTNGISALENAALRQSMLSSINSQNLTAMRALRGQQAANGVRGGVAQAQMAGQQAQAVGSLAEAERGLVGDNIKYKQEGLKNAASIVSNQEGSERDQAADKLNSVLTLRGQDMSMEAARMQAEAAAKQQQKGKK